MGELYDIRVLPLDEDEYDEGKQAEEADDTADDAKYHVCKKTPLKSMATTGGGGVKHGQMHSQMYHLKSTKQLLNQS